jgi:hypothetical protein
METMLPRRCQHTRAGNFCQYRRPATTEARQPHVREAAMIARLWRGAASGGNAALYRTHFSEAVLPHLQGLTGFSGAWLLQRHEADDTEFLAVTLWSSADAIRAFTGPDIGIAVVEPEARAVLARADGFATHFEVAIEAGPQR